MPALHFSSMTKLEVPYKGKVYLFKIPARWDEVAIDDLAYIVPLLPKWRELYYKWVGLRNVNTSKASELDVQLQRLRIALLKRLVKLPKWPWNKRVKAFWSMYADEVAELLQSLNFIFTENDRKDAPIPYFKYKGKFYFAPEHNFKNISGSEFAFAEAAHQAYLKDQNQAHLRRLVAVLYRSRGEGPAHDPKSHSYIGDVRRVFNKARLELDEQAFEKLPSSFMVLTFFWWQCYREDLQKRHPKIFSRKNTDEAEADALGWIGVFRALASHPTHIEETAQMRMSEILMELNARQAERRKAELARLNSRKK